MTAAASVAAAAVASAAAADDDQSLIPASEVAADAAWLVLVVVAVVAAAAAVVVLEVAVVVLLSLPAEKAHSAAAQSIALATASGAAFWLRVGRTKRVWNGSETGHSSAVAGRASNILKIS